MDQLCSYKNKKKYVIAVLVMQRELRRIRAKSDQINEHPSVSPLIRGEC
jgi:uncharacterized membrane-anchored protein YitT (DUF2179 family)